MSNYRRAYVPGGSYFFTVVTERRAPILCTETSRACLREALLECRRRWPFRIDAMVLLNEHLHAIWTLTEGDTRYSTRWGWIKKEFTKAYLAAGGTEQPRNASRLRQRRRGVLHRRFWEHAIRDEADYFKHFDYLHYNPVKHGYVECVRDWPYSTFHKWVKHGVYAPDWGCKIQGLLEFGDLDTTAME
jgi:putative transposase